MPRLTLKQKRKQAERESDALMAVELLLIAAICFTPWIGGFVSFGKSLVTFLGFYFAEFVSVGINEESLVNNLFYNLPKIVYFQISHWSVKKAEKKPGLQNNKISSTYQSFQNELGLSNALRDLETHEVKDRLAQSEAQVIIDNDIKLNSQPDPNQSENKMSDYFVDEENIKGQKILELNL